MAKGRREPRRQDEESANADTQKEHHADGVGWGWTVSITGLAVCGVGVEEGSMGGESAQAERNQPGEARMAHRAVHSLFCRARLANSSPRAKSRLSLFLSIKFYQHTGPPLIDTLSMVASTQR